MKNETSSNTNSIDKVNTILNELKKKGNLEGVVFSDRNGNLITENIGNNFDGEIFSAMCATVLESANDLRKNLNSNTLNKIIANLESGRTIIIIECDDNTFLSFILNKESNINSILNNIEDYFEKILTNYK